MDDGPEPLTRLALEALHLARGARLMPFAGHAMPVQYAEGILAEHRHCRAGASLFDVSHMGQVILRPAADMAGLARALEALMPVDVLGLAPGRQRYGLLTTETGGVIDDLMIAHRGDHFLCVVNASRVAVDVPHLVAGLGGAAEVTPVTDRCLLALQGPGAEAALAPLVPAVTAMRFLDVIEAPAAGWPRAPLWIARSGYTGEDGFEISLPAEMATGFAEALLAQPGVALAGLGARDTLRLEAGLCLYGHELTETISPVEAALGWAIPKLRRRGGARAGGFAGDGRILAEFDQGPTRLRVGLIPEGRAPWREGTPLFDATGAAAGAVTSGGFGPSVGGPLSMSQASSQLNRMKEQVINI